jgi:tetratricopeptide (TPR) repeat protein
VPLGRLEEAVAEHDRAAELDPLAPMVRFSQAHASHMTGRTDRALSLLRTASELFPDYILGGHLSCLVCMGAGLREEAAEALKRVMRADPENPLSLASEAVVHGGDPAESKRLRGKFEDLAKGRRLPRYLFIILATAAGDYAEAISWIDQAISERETLLLLLTFRDPFFRELRAHERFPEVLRKLNLSA